jgi:C4-dicarboxylate transporter DctQ subunit
MLKVKEKLIKFESFFVVFLLIAMFVIVLYEVLARYLGFSLYWSEELAKYFFIWMIMVGSVIAFEKGLHFYVNIFFKHFSTTNQRKINIFGNILVASFVVLLFFEGILFCINAKGMTTPGLGIPQYYAYMAIPLGAFLMLVHIVLNIFKKN